MLVEGDESEGIAVAVVVQLEYAEGLPRGGMGDVRRGGVDVVECELALCRVNAMGDC